MERLRALLAADASPKGSWDAGEHEGCGKDTERAVARLAADAASPASGGEWNERLAKMLSIIFVGDENDWQQYRTKAALLESLLIGARFASPSSSPSVTEEEARCLKIVRARATFWNNVSKSDCPGICSLPIAEELEDIAAMIRGK